MIHATRTVTVGDNESIIDKPIVLYRGDREVEIEFTLLGNEFRFSDDGNVIKSSNASHGQLVLNTPSGENMFSEVSKCHDGNVVFIITKEMIDEFIEVGFYNFQIRLYDGVEMKSRMTIPPVLNGIDIRNPIAAEDETNVVDQGIVDYARIFKDQSNEELPTFDWSGAYNKTEWVHHDVITENKMNKIEDALYSINANVKESDVVMLNTLDQVKKDADKYVKEHMAEVEQDVEDFERNLNTDVQQFKIDTNAAMTAHKNEVSEELERIVILLKPNGVDDTEQIQEAIDKCSINGGIVDLGVGEYVSSKLIIKSDVTLRGRKGKTFLRCVDKTNDLGLDFGSFLRKADDGNRVINFNIEHLHIITAISSVSLSEDNYNNMIGINLCGCERSNFINVTISGFGYGGLILARAENGEEGLGFYNTVQDGNYNVFTNLTVNSCGKYNEEQASIWLKYKANSNNFYGVFGKPNKKAIVITHGNNNNIFGMTCESSTTIIKFGSSCFSTNVFGARGELIFGNAFEFDDNSKFNTVFNPYLTGVEGENFYNIDNTDRNNVFSSVGTILSSGVFPPVSSVSTEHNLGFIQLKGLNGDDNHPFVIKSKNFNDNTPVMEMWDSKLAVNKGDSVSEIWSYCNDSSSNSKGVNAKIKTVAKDTTGNLAYVFSVGREYDGLVDSLEINKNGIEVKGYITLTSPNGTVYKLTVDDDGSLKTSL